MLAAFNVLAGYLAGSVPFGVLLTRRLRGVDVRTQGSGNIGATNVARVAGKKLGVVVLLLDAAKGALPVMAALWLLPGAFWVHAAVGLAAFLGHVFPPWLKFRGGKGVATALGVLLVLLPWAALMGFAVYATAFALWRVSSVGSLLGGLCTVAAAWLLEQPSEYATLATLLFCLMLLTHRANIYRLLRRAEKAL
jgi:glycerol-3-phosphate acyltransferase PlsY